MTAGWRKSVPPLRAAAGAGGNPRVATGRGHGCAGSARTAPFTLWNTVRLFASATDCPLADHGGRTVAGAGKAQIDIDGRTIQTSLFARRIRSLIGSCDEKGEKMNKVAGPFLAILLLMAGVRADEGDEPKQDQRLKSSTFSGLELRSIGPALMSGRIADIAIDPIEAEHVVRGGRFGQSLEDHQCGDHLANRSSRTMAPIRSVASRSIRNSRFTDLGGNGRGRGRTACGIRRWRLPEPGRR